MVHRLAPMRTLICDSRGSHTTTLASRLSNEELVASVDIVHSLSEVTAFIGSTEVDAIYIDPIEMGIEEAGDLILGIREAAPRIVFVLFVDVTQVRERDAEFHHGRRSRFRHYYVLDKSMIAEERFPEHLSRSVYLCSADLYNNDSSSRIAQQRDAMRGPKEPVEVRDSLAAFRQRFPNKTGFVMMQFGGSAAHNRISDAIHSALEPFDGIEAVRADALDFHDDLYWNVMTYAHGCDFGIAVFERIEEDSFNPNVSLEVGYMMALGKPVCLLKDKTLKTLHTDLIGKLYREFDPHSPRTTIGSALRNWIATRAFADPEEILRS